MHCSFRICHRDLSNNMYCYFFQLKLKIVWPVVQKNPCNQMIEVESTSALCENFSIFQSLRFCVKSILGIFEVEKLPFSQFQILWIFIFWKLKLQTLQNSEQLKLKKTALFEFQEVAKLISRKIWVTEISKNLHTVFWKQTILLCCMKVHVHDCTKVEGHSGLF